MDVGESTLLQQTSAEDQGSFVRELLLQISFLNQFHEYAQLLERLLELIHVKVVVGFHLADALTRNHLLFNLLHEHVSELAKGGI